MNKEISIEINELMLDFTKRLNDSLLSAKDACDHQEFEKYKDEVSKIMTIMYLDIMKPIHKMYPDTEPDSLK